MAALAEACASDGFPARVAAVIAGAESAATERAREMGLAVSIVAPGDYYGERLVEALEGCELLCLAGFLRLLPSPVLEAFPRRVLNIHPSLLPKFGGKGMYGLRVHEAVLAAGESESGCTVHRVTEKYDEGEVLVQLRCPVVPGDTPETLAGRVLELEHRAYPEAVRKVLHE